MCPTHRPQLPYLAHVRTNLPCVKRVVYLFIPTQCPLACPAGFSGAELANVVNEGTLLAARKESDVVTLTELLEGMQRTKYVLLLFGVCMMSRLLSACHKNS